MKTKYIKRKYPKFYILAAFTLLCFLAVGYSYINSDLGIEASALAASNRWNIAISNMQVNSSSTYGSQTNNSTGSQLTFDLSLTSGGQSYIIDFDVTNNGTLNAYLKEISYESIGSIGIGNYLEYKYTYSDGTEVKLNDVLAPNQTVHMKLYINYNRKLTYDYNEGTNSQTIAYGININYYFKGNQKQKIAIYNNDNKLVSTEYLPINGDYIEIDSNESYKLVACYGASAYEENNKIRISYTPGETDAPFCRILNDIQVLNYLDAKEYPNLNIYLLKDYQYQNQSFFYYGGRTKLYLNGKNLNLIGKTSGNEYDNAMRFYSLKIINNTGNSVVNIYDKVFESNYLYFDGGTYNIIMSIEDRAIISYILMLDNATINISNTNYSEIMESHHGTIVMNSTINAFYTPLSISQYTSYDNYIAVLNSNVTTNNSNSIGVSHNKYGPDDMYNVYICNSTIDSATYDIDNTYGSVIYSSDSHFNSTAPTLKTPNNNTYVIEDYYACNVINQRLKEANSLMNMPSPEY